MEQQVETVASKAMQVKYKGHLEQLP